MTKKADGNVPHTITVNLLLYLPYSLELQYFQTFVLTVAWG